jgi:hypothetical protein
MYSALYCVALPSYWVQKSKLLRAAAQTNTGKLRKWEFACYYNSESVFVLLSNKMSNPKCTVYKALLIEASGSVFLSLPKEWVEANTLFVGDRVSIDSTLEWLKITKYGDDDVGRKETSN